jgi:hypothetical protein
MDNDYHVYFYLRSRDSAIGKAGTPYYVGKGKGRRAYSNTRLVPVPEDKNNIVFVLENLTEEQAFRNEIDFISWYGRVNSGNGILRNLTDGGEGSSGLILSEENKRKNRERRKNKNHSEESKRKTRESMEKYWQNADENRRNQINESAKLYRQNKNKPSVTLDQFFKE